MLKQRIEILNQANVIDNDVAKYCIEVIDLLEKEHFDEEKMVVFTTHLAMATQRAKNKEDLQGLDESIWKQVKDNKNFVIANQLYLKIVTLSPIEYEDSEYQYLMMHLCNLLN